MKAINKTSIINNLFIITFIHSRLKPSRSFNKYTNRSCHLFFLIGLLINGPLCIAQTVTLPSLNAKPNDITISGFSSGAFMAVQFAVAHSSKVTGVATIAGGPYYCAQGNANIGFTDCLIGYPDTQKLIDLTNQWQGVGLIDTTDNISQQKIWLFHGYNDGRVKSQVSDSLFEYYASYTRTENIFYKNTIRAGHSVITNTQGVACDNSDSPYLNNCNYDAAGKLLQQLYGKLTPRNTGNLTGRFIQFDQNNGDFFTGNINTISMADTGYAYIPEACDNLQPCRVHVALHGCKQYAGRVGDVFYRKAGYNEWADMNHIIVLYPQTTSRQSLPNNPDGCWDSWGYTNKQYTLKSGKQITAIHAMLSRLTADYSGWDDITPLQGSYHLQLADSTNEQINLQWTAIEDALGYHIYRASCASCTFNLINTELVSGLSFTDHHLSPLSTYFYKVRAEDEFGNLDAYSNVVQGTTEANPPFCDPYRRDNVTHTLEGRAFQWFGSTYLYNTYQYIGAWRNDVFSNLKQIQPFFFAKGTCQ